MDYARIRRNSAIVATDAARRLANRLHLGYTLRD
jgi:hypothetical protein